MENIDDRFKKIIEKADTIVRDERRKEELERKINALREKYGKLKISIEKQRIKIENMNDNYQRGMEIRKQHELYFQLINTYSGKELEKKLATEIDDYEWSKYSKIQDQVNNLTGRKTEKEFDTELMKEKYKLIELTNRIESLTDELHILLDEYENLVK